MMNFARTLAMVKKQHPLMDEQDARDLANDWMCEAAEEAAQREDTPCLDAPWWSHP
jgi:hypothetical protein